jgi:hypothetical protein
VRTLIMLIFAAALACRSDAHSSSLAALHTTPTNTGWTIELKLPTEDLLAVLRAGFAPSGDPRADLAPVQDAMLAYIGSRLELSEGGAALTPRVSLTGFDCDRTLITADVTSSGAVSLASRIFTELDRRYRIAVVHIDRTGRRAQREIWPEGAPLDLGGTPGSADAGPLLPSARRGAEHAVGLDHVLLLIALTLIPTTLWRPLALVVCFTLAHALASAGRGFLTLSPSLAEPIFAAAICYVAIENLFVDEAPARWPLALALGLVHGSGSPEISGSHTGFHIGLLLGQLAIVLLLYPVSSRLARRDGLLTAGSLALLFFGLVIFLERIGR